MDDISKETQISVDRNYDSLSLDEKIDLHGLYSNKDIANDVRSRLEKVIFRMTPPTPEEYLDHRNGWVTKSFEDSIYPHVKEDFIEILDEEKNYNQIVEYGATRLGKCEGRDTPVLMYDLSVKMIQDIKVGDLLMGDDGNPRKVLETHKGYGKLYKVHQNKADDYIVNENHILTLQYAPRIKPNGEYDEKSNKTIDIPLKKYLNFTKSHKLRLKGIKSPLYFPYKEVKIDPYYLGLWLGDGHKNGPTITTIDEEIKNYVYDYAKKLKLRVSITNHKISEVKHYRICGNTIASINNKNDNTLFYNLRDTYNLFNNKHIPIDYLKNSEEIRLQLLGGILDTDGSLDKRKSKYEIGQSNKKLADQICFLAQSLGFRCNVKKRIMNTNFKKNAVFYVMYITGDLSRIPTKIKRKQVVKNTNRVNFLRTGIQIEENGYGEFYGFELDGNHRYLHSDLTITHNSYMSRMIIHYILIYVHCIRHPQLYYNLAPTTKLSIYIMSFVAEQANKILLDPIYKLLDMSPRFKKEKFQDKVAEEQYKNGLDNIYWSKAGTGSKLTVESGLTLNIGTDVLSFIGTDLLFLTVSEINFFIEKAGTSHDQIFQLYSDGLARIKATVGNNYLGMVYLDSSANDEENPIEQYILGELPKQEKVFFRQRAQWGEKDGKRISIGTSSFPKWEKTGKTFDVFLGNKEHPPKLIMDKNELKKLPKNLILNPPIDLYDNFKLNILKAIKDNAGIPTRKENKFIQDSNIITGIFSNSSINNIEGLIKADASEIPSNLIWNQVKNKFFSKYNVDSYNISRAHGSPRFIGLDPSFSSQGDIYGLSMLHTEWSMEFSKIIYVYDFSFGITGGETGINLEAVSRFIMDLIEKGQVNVHSVAVDQFQSQQLLQTLTRYGVNAVRQSVDREINQYVAFHTYMINEQVKVGKNVFLKNNLDSLITTERKGKEVIDHSSGKVEKIYNGDFEFSRCGINSKDVSDSAVQAFWLAVNTDLHPQVTYEDENKKFSEIEDKSELISKSYKQLKGIYR